MFKHLKNDITSSIVVYLVALPLCLGIALASGAPLLSGLISGIIGGIVVGFLSGSSTSVSGPAAGLATIVLASILKLGDFQTFSAALVLAGVLQIILGFFKAGKIANFIPSNVITGLLAAIGLLLILKQVPHALGYDVNHEDVFSFYQPNGENTFSHLFGSVDHFQIASGLISLFGLVLLFSWSKIIPKKFQILPGSLAVVALSIGLNELFARILPELALGSEHLVKLPALTPSQFFSFSIPEWSLFTNYNVLVVACTIALVASLETLLNLEAVDSIDPLKRKSPPNRELLAQGAGNLIAGVLGGLPVTSVIVRSSVNINSGGRTKFAAILHGVLLLISILTIPFVLNKIPLASLAAILIVTGHKLANFQVFKKMYLKGWNDFLPFAATVIGILFTDLLVGIFIGLCTSVFFIVKNIVLGRFHHEKTQVYKDQTIRIDLPTQLTFLNRSSFKDSLMSIPEGSRVILDASKTEYMDSDVRDLITEFSNVIAKEKNIKVNYLGKDGAFSFVEYMSFLSTLDKQTQENLTPEEILGILKTGNERFLRGKWNKKNLRDQVTATSAGQYPMATVLSCIDSRSAPETIFDTNIGDLISVRIAGNIVTDEIIGSMELAHSKIGTKLIVIMGHSNCGAIGLASKNVTDGHICHITAKIRPSIDEALALKFSSISDRDFAEEVCQINIRRSMKEILSSSTYITDQINSGNLGIVCAYYDTSTGQVEFEELYSKETQSLDAGDFSVRTKAELPQGLLHS